MFLKVKLTISWIGFGSGLVPVQQQATFWIKDNQKQFLSELQKSLFLFLIKQINQNFIKDFLMMISLKLSKLSINFSRLIYLASSTHYGCQWPCNAKNQDTGTY